MSDIIPGSQPFYFQGGGTGCLLLHGFSSTPEEMRPLGEYLSSQGYSVLGMRLSGHGTQPADLAHTRWSDWLIDVEDGLSILTSTCQRVILIGQSMGGMIALVAAARFAVQGVVTLSTPCGNPPRRSFRDQLRLAFQPTFRKPVPRYPPDHPLHHRRELNYPAYPELPTRIFIQLDALSREMMLAIPHVTAPTLIIHSKADQGVPFDCMEKIHAHLGSARKEMLALEGMDHSLVMDPNRQVVFEAVDRFLSTLSK